MQTNKNNMEEEMKSIVTRIIDEYKENANKLNTDKFTELVCNSFIDARSMKHYVVLVVVDLDDTFNAEQHHSLEKQGFFQVQNQSTFNNVFFASEKVVKNMVALLTQSEGMAVDQEKDNYGGSVFVVSISGIVNTHYYRDLELANGAPGRNGNIQ